MKEPGSGPSLRERALGFLARREYSRAELARKLASHGSPDEIAVLLDDLAAHGQLSDARYAEALAHARQGKYGSLRLRQELKEKGVRGADAEAVVQAAREDDLAAARDVWRKKFGTPATDLKEKARQIRFLVTRGFPTEIVRRVVGQDDE